MGKSPLGSSNVVCSLKHQNCVGIIKDFLILVLSRIILRKVLFLGALGGVPEEGV